jgi:5'-nucleotidase
MHRRTFLKHGGILLAGGLLLKHNLSAKPSKRQIVVLHTNDFHSRMTPFPAFHKSYPNQGGIQHLAQFIQEYRSKNEHVLLFDSGDVFQGTPYFNVFKGRPELTWMQKMNYDASTLGNHDFDAGYQHLFKLRKEFQTPTLLVNYDFQQNHDLGVIQTHKIIQKGPIKIGVTGVCIDLKELQSESNQGSFRYQNPIERVQNQVHYLRKSENCDLVIVLSHLGFQYENDKIDDIKLAQQTEGIDAILGGHTHTFLNEPLAVKNKNNKITLVNQAGWAGLRLGKLIFEY